MKRYFAYGSNMDAMQIKDRCPQSIKKEKVVLVGYEFFINGRGFANIRKKKEGKTYGIIYDISQSDEKNLDKKKGVQFGINKKESIESIDAFYYFAKNVDEGSPKEGYLEKIINAAMDNKFPASYIEELQSWRKNANRLK